MYNKECHNKKPMNIKIKNKEFKRNLILIIIFVVALSAAIFIPIKKYQETLSADRQRSEQLADLEAKIWQQYSIKIPKINVDAPVIQGVDPANKDLYNQELKNGVLLMPGSSTPGSGSGNIFIYGHSSAVVESRYSKIFANLNNLKDNDQIIITYSNQNFVYLVNGKKIVERNDLSVLDQTKNETLALMTCWPLGADDKRLIITAVSVK